MKTIKIAFDVDGTLISNEFWDNDIIPNKRIVEMLKTFYSFKNVKIYVWSGRGEKWPDKVVDSLGLRKYVHQTFSKNYKGISDIGQHIFEPDFTPDIAIDDIQDCELWDINLIVKEK